MSTSLRKIREGGEGRKIRGVRDKLGRRDGEKEEGRGQGKDEGNEVLIDIPNQLVICGSKMKNN